VFFLKNAHSVGCLLDKTANFWYNFRQKKQQKSCSSFQNLRCFYGTVYHYMSISQAKLRDSVRLRSNDYDEGGRPMTKKFLYIAASVVIFALGVSALANEKPVSFPDVPADSSYHDAVVYFSSRGIVSRQEDGLFHPETEMSSQEWKKILADIGSDSAQFDSGTAAVDPAALYASIWSAAKIKTYCASEYGYDSDLDAGTTAMIVTGLLHGNDLNKKSVSRGEALRLLHEVIIKKSVTEVPVNLVDLFEVTIGEGCSPDAKTEVHSLLAAFPNNQLALLLAYHYQFVVLTDLSLAPNGHAEQLGFEDTGEHIIYLKESGISQALIHEVGHAIETCHSSYSKTWSLNKAEGDAGAEFLGKYAGINANEYIAEATRYFIENKDDGAVLEKMKAAIPQTYEYLAGIMNESPFLTEAHFLSAVSNG